MFRIVLVTAGLLALAAEMPAQARLRLTVRGSDGYTRQAIGWLAEVNDDSVVVVNGTHRIAFERHRVTRVERSRGLGTSAAARTGALVLGGSALVLGWTMTSPCNPGAWIDLFCGASAADVIKVTLFSAVTGATLGAMIGTLNGERWQAESLHRIGVRGTVSRSGGGVSLNLTF